MQIVSIVTAILTLLAGEWLVGHWVLFPLFCFGAGLRPGLAIRLAHAGGLLLGYAFAAGQLARTADVVVWWGGAPLMPGLALMLVALVWLIVVVFAPPGPGPAER